MRKVEFLVVHCSATMQHVTLAAIKEYFKMKGWDSPGYHYLIAPDGTTEEILPIQFISNGVIGHNYNSINIAYIGGVDYYGHALDNRTPQQKEALVTLLTELKTRFPDAKIVGHRDLSKDLNNNGIIEPGEWVKECPSFNARKEYSKIKPQAR